MYKLKILFALVVTIAISSCFMNNSETVEIVAPIYSNAIYLKVKRVEVVSEFSPSFKRPNVEHLFPTPLEKSAKEWALKNLEASAPSSDKTAYFIIKDASVVESFEPSQQAFHKDRSKYYAKLHIVLKITDDKELSRAQTEIQAWRELLIPVDTPLIEKEKYWNDMSNKMFSDFDIKMRENINKYLNMYVEGNTMIVDYN